MDDTAFQEGYVAFREGFELSDNPYNEGSDEYDSWESGWVTAADEEEESE
jgi:hypothetical protein